MRNLTVAIVLATTALSGSALARDKAWYVGLEGGGMLVENYHFRLTDTAGVRTPDAVRVKNSAGFDVDGNVGYDFGIFRTEFEVGYKQANFRGININQALNNFGTAGVSGPANYGEAFDRSSALSFMANAMLDVGDQNAWSGFVGGGAGVARVELKGLRYVRAAPAIVDDSDTHFAWQAIAGVRRHITDNVDIGLKYRFFNVPDLKFRTANGEQLKDRFRSHSLLLTLAYNFGEVAAPPPPPVTTPTPPPPPPQLPPPPPPAVQPGPFLIFFDWDRSVITPEASQVLDRAIEQFRSTGQTSVALAGHTDKSGTANYNMGLSMRRANATKAYMTAHGVPDSVIATQGFGESRPLVETADGVREPQNRRVEITFAGGGSGGAMASTAPADASAPPPTPRADASSPGPVTSTTTTNTDTTTAPKQ